MQGGVDYGTGKTVKTPGYSVGGKTGTAETIDPNTHKRSETEYVVSFVGCVPAEDPQIAIYVVVDRLNAAKQDNARVATKLARSILMEALPYLNIFMTEELTEEEIAELNALQLKITSQYTQTPEEDALEGEDGSGSGNPPEGGDQNGGTLGDNAGNSGDNGSQPPWMAYPVDPETGYRVDPETGRQYEAQTGIPVEGGESVPNPDVPVNPSLP